MASALWPIGNAADAVVEVVSDPRQCAGFVPDLPATCVAGCNKSVVDIIMQDDDAMRGYPVTVHAEELIF